MTLKFGLEVINRGVATVLKVGRTFLRAEQAKKFLDPPLVLASGGDKILLLFRCLQAASRKYIDGVMRHTPG